MVDVSNFVEVIALTPLMAFALILVFGDKMPKKGALAGIAATGTSLLISLWTVVGGLELYYKTRFYFSVNIAGRDVDLSFGLLIDPLSALMLVVVLLISFLVYIFSLGYVDEKGEADLPQYYAVLGLLTFSTLALIYSVNLIMMFIFFELMGLCLFKLLCYWSQDDALQTSSKRTLVPLVLFDFLLFMGIVGVFAIFGTTDIVRTLFGS